MREFSLNSDKWNYGPDVWTGIVFGSTFQIVMDWAEENFLSIEHGGEFIKHQSLIKWPEGQRLFFRHVRKDADYWCYHGHVYSYTAFIDPENMSEHMITCFTKKSYHHSSMTEVTS